MTSTQTSPAEAPPPVDLRPHAVAYLANNLRTNGYEHHARTMEALAELRAAGEPSDEELMEVWMRSPQGPHMRDQLLGYARALLSRYAAPQASANATALRSALSLLERTASEAWRIGERKTVEWDALGAALGIARGVLKSALAAQAAHKPDGGDAERIRNASAILDCLTSKLGSDHPLRLEAVEGAKRAVADLYRIADEFEAAISAQQRQEGK